MSNLKGKQYHKTDKDIHDQLMQRSPSKASILRHLQLRGLLFSHKIERDDLTEQISCWFTSYFDVKFIVEELGGGNSQRYNSCTEILNDLNEESIREILNDLSKECNFKHQAQHNGSFTISKSYSTSDFTKNVLSQTIHKKAELKIERTADNIIFIRTNTDAEAVQIVHKFKDKIKEKLKEKEQEYQDFEISFESLPNAIARTEFFLEIINNINGYKTIDMKSAAINSMDTPSSITEDTDSEKIGCIKKVILNGDSVHESTELKSLLDKGFYLTKIEWTMISESLNGDKIDLCAEFEDTINCTNFKYALLRIYPRKSDSDEFVKMGKTPSSVEFSSILPKIEQSAKKSFIKIRDKYQSRNDETSDESS